ncbi:hypothetical protein [Halomonas denitrificans]|nr:hypothetical protein [Halomonas denitrificans]
MTRRTGIVCAFVALVATGLAGCGGPVELDADERAAAEQALYPPFHRVHGRVLPTSPDGLEARLTGLLDRLREAGAELPSTVDVVLTVEADPDALCLAGGRIVIGRGLLAWLHSDDEAAAVLAAAGSMCRAADRAWRAGASKGLPADEPDSLRKLRYIDVRLDGNAALYRQAVAGACGGDCASVVPASLREAGFDGEAFHRLVHRLSVERPESLWLERVGGAAASAAADGAGAGDWSGLADLRDGLEHLAVVRREIGRGRLDRAYRAVLAAGRTLPDDVDGRYLHAELDLRNNHAYYARDRLEALLAEGHRLPDADYLRGWILAHLRELEDAEALLGPELVFLPRAPGLYEMAVVRVRQGRDEEAAALLERADAAGPTSPYADAIDTIEQLIERRRR